MIRQTLSPEALAFVAERRAYHHDEAAVNGADDEYEPKDRRDREDVVSPLCRVKRDDDVEISGYPFRVIGPARAEGWLYLLQEAPWGLMDIPFDASGITDRAPADSEEEALPIFVES